MKKPLQTGILLILFIAGLALAAYMLYRLSNLALIVLVAIVLSTGIDPIVTWLQQKAAPWWKMPRAAATMVVILFGVSIFLGLVTTLIIAASNQATDFASTHSNTPVLQWYDAFSKQAWVKDAFQKYQLLPAPKEIVGQMRAQTGQVFWMVIQWVVVIVGGIFSLLVTLILTTFFTIYKDGINYTLLQFVPPHYQQRTREVCHLAAIKMGGWMRGQLMMALIISILITLGVTLLGLKSYAALIGLIGGLGELVPMVGPYMGFIPAVVIGYGIGLHPWQILLLALFFVLLSQVENYVIMPRIMARQVDVHPVTAILALISGALLFQVPGALLAMPFAAAMRVILLEAVFPAIQRKTREDIECGRPQDHHEEQVSGEADELAEMVNV
ncbi:MAG: AI-2E family transporter [Armatimonadota bacterium]